MSLIYQEDALPRIGGSTLWGPTCGQLTLAFFLPRIEQMAILTCLGYQKQTTAQKYECIQWDSSILWDIRNDSSQVVIWDGHNNRQSRTCKANKILEIGAV